MIAEIVINHRGLLGNTFRMVDAATKTKIKIIKHSAYIFEDKMSMKENPLHLDIQRNQYMTLSKKTFRKRNYSAILIGSYQNLFE